MTSVWAAAAQAQMAGSVVRPTLFLRVAIPSAPLRVWSGVGDYDVPVDAVEVEGATYLGVGAVAGLPALSGLINGVAERVEFSLSGVSARVLSIADDESVDCRNAQVNIGLTFLGEDWQPVGGMGWLWQGFADVATAARTAGEDGTITRRISLSVGSAFTGRRRAPLTYWSNNDQQRRSPTDRFCERTPLYNPGVIKTWPRF